MKGLVVGCGSIGSRHARNLSDMDDLEVLLFDKNDNTSKAVAEKTGGKAVRTLEKGLSEAPDFALICTPTSLHLDQARKVVEGGCHAFIEKPISHNQKGVRELVELGKKKSRVLLVGCNMRFHPPVKRIQEWLDENRIGRIQFVRLRYANYLPNWREKDYRDSYSVSEESGGGIILDAVHELDLALKWLGTVERVQALAGTFSDLDLDVEDTAEILLTSSGRSAGEIHLDYLRPQRARTYELIGGDGMIRWEAEGKSPEISRVRYFDKSGEEREQVRMDSNLNEMYVDEMKHFLRCIKGDQQPVMDGERAATVLQLALRAKRASKEGSSQSFTF